MTQKQKNVFESIENKVAEIISLLETHATPELISGKKNGRVSPSGTQVRFQNHQEQQYYI